MGAVALLVGLVVTGVTTVASAAEYNSQEVFGVTGPASAGIVAGTLIGLAFILAGLAALVGALVAGLVRRRSVV